MDEDGGHRKSVSLLVGNICGYYMDNEFGGETDESMPASTIPDITRGGYYIRIRKRQMSVCRLGWIKILAKLLRNDELPFGMFIPEPMVEVSKSLAIQRSLRKQKSKTYP